MSITSRILERQPYLPHISFEPSLYHESNSSGYFTLSVHQDRWRETTYQLNLLPFVIKQVNPKLDSYISQAEFYRRRRLVVNLWRINVCWVELDTWDSINYGNMTPEAIAQEILTHCEYEGIPSPSLIISSGRGIHVKWLFAKPVFNGQLPAWNSLQKELSRRFSNFGSDICAIDGARVLRLVNTVNTKNNSVCRVLWVNGPDDNPQRYFFDSLCSNILPYTREEVRAYKERLKRRAPSRATNEARECGGLRKFNAEQLSWDRFHDIGRLALFRYGADGVVEGYLDKFLFLSAWFLSWADPEMLLNTTDPKRAYKEVLEIGRQFAPTFRENQVRTYAGSAYRRARAALNGKITTWNGKPVDPRYRFRNQTIIEWLKISGNEERYQNPDGSYLLRTIVSKSEARRRNRERDEKRRRKKGQPDRRARAAERKEKAQILYQQGETISVIAEKLGIHYETVRLYVR